MDRSGPRSLAEPTAILTEHNCSRCGEEFFSISERVKVCPACKDKTKSKRPAGKGDSIGAPLSVRERQVADLITDEGLANKLVAYRLHLSEGTIKVYLFHIFKKTGMSNRTQLCMWVVKERKKQNK